MERAALLATAADQGECSLDVAMLWRNLETVQLGEMGRGRGEKMDGEGEPYTEYRGFCLARSYRSAA